MTESEWLASTDPAAMLRLYTSDAMPWPAGVPAPVVSDRKLRLFACACLAPSICSIYTENRILKASPVDFAVSVLPHMVGCCFKPHEKQVQTEKANLLREIIGNPYRPYRRFGKGICDHTMKEVGEVTPAINAIAQGIYDDRTFEDMPILADAIEDAGCEDAEIPNHCRGLEPCLSCHWPYMEFGPGGGSYWCPQCGGTQDMHKGDGWMQLRGPHARSCWVLDLLLGNS